MLTKITTFLYLYATLIALFLLTIMAIETIGTLTTLTMVNTKYLLISCHQIALHQAALLANTAFPLQTSQALLDRQEFLKEAPTFECQNISM